MVRVRRCDKRCHEAKGARCKCWCGGYYHGESGEGPANRETLEQAAKFIEEHGGKSGETYVDQLRLKI